MTPDNQAAAWLNFEAGAMIRTVEKSMVCPYLFGMKKSELQGPLVQLQATEANKDETLRLISTLNRALKDKALGEKTLNIAFERGWPDLHSMLNAIPAANPHESVGTNKWGYARRDPGDSQRTGKGDRKFEHRDRSPVATLAAW